MLPILLTVVRVRRIAPIIISTHPWIASTIGRLKLFWKFIHIGMQSLSKGFDDNGWVNGKIDLGLVVSVSWQYQNDKYEKHWREICKPGTCLGRVETGRRGERSKQPPGGNYHCIFVFVFVYIFFFIFVYLYLYICIFIFIYFFVYLYLYIRIFIFVFCIFVFSKFEFVYFYLLFVFIYLYLIICIWIYVLFFCICICVFGCSSANGSCELYSPGQQGRDVEEEEGFCIFVFFKFVFVYLYLCICICIFTCIAR